MTETKKVSWFTKVFEDYFVVELFLHDGSHRTFHMKEVKKISNNLLKGTDLEGSKVEYCTKEPFDYYIKKLY